MPGTGRWTLRTVTSRPIRSMRIGTPHRGEPDRFRRFLLSQDDHVVGTVSRPDGSAPRSRVGGPDSWAWADDRRSGYPLRRIFRGRSGSVPDVAAHFAP